MKQTSTEHSEIVLRDDQVLEYRYRDGSMVDLTAARKMVETALRLAGSAAPCPTVVVAGGVKAVTREAREFFAQSDENRSVSSCVALVVNSPVARVIGNFFMGLNKPRIPTRLFKSVEDALPWLTEEHERQVARSA